MEPSRYVVAVSVEDGGVRIKSEAIDELGGSLGPVAHQFDARLDEHKEISPEFVVASIRRFWRDHCTKRPPESLAIATFGHVTNAGMLVGVPRGSKVEEHRFNYRFELQDLIEPWRVIVENDATACVLGEYADGSGQGHATFCYIYIGRGVNCGLFLNGEVWRSAIHPEAGHIRPAPYWGPGVGARHWSRHVLPTCVHRDPPCYESLMSLNARLDLERRRIPMKERIDFWGYTIAQFVNTLNLIIAPPRIVIGGSALTKTSAAPIPANKFLARVRSHFKTLHAKYPLHEQTARPEQFIVPASLGEQAACHGALALARRLAVSLGSTQNGKGQNLAGPKG